MLRVTKTFPSLTWLVILATFTIVAQSQTPVLDTSGNPLEKGVEYYILPAAFDVAGGLTLLDRFGNGSCPLYVAQEPLARPVTSNGLPAVFTPNTAGQTIINEGEDFSVAFSAATTCVQSTTWRIDNPSAARRLIVAGSNPSPFRIENNNGLYNLGYCPSDCPNCRVRCSPAGIVEENGNRLLSLDVNAYFFRFQRA